ncbi:MAG: T9SS type A sorting domain-containing protein [Bacteroidetes bacterium]|nr:T9SS type A sorting domain-containing protein [Bacteroidota bacterium]
MRKITLMLTLLSFSFLTFAQMSIAEKEKSNADFHVNNYKSVKSIKASGEVFFEEHFDETRWAASVNDENLAIPDKMPDGWSVYDRTKNKFNWHWSKQGPRGKYCSGNADVLEPDNTMIIHSNTPDNGFMMLESAYFNTDASGNIVATSIDMDCFLQSPAYDLSGTAGVILKFEEYFRYCCSSADSKLDVLVSADFDPTDSNIDNGHWTTYDVRQGMNPNEAFDGSVELNISSVAADQSTVYIRWQQTASSHYQWQIDDVQLIEPMSNNIMIEKTWADYLYLPNDMVTDYDATFDWNGGYVDIPLDLVGDFKQFRAAVKNFGLATQTNVQLNTVITKDGETEVFNKTSDKLDIEKSKRDTLLITDGFTPTQKGHYQVSYTVSQDQDDELMTDNYDGSYFNITDSVFSRTSSDKTNYTSVSPQDYVNAADGDYILNYYQIPEGSENVTVSSVTIYFSKGNDSTTIAQGKMSTVFNLYGIEDRKISETPIVSSDTYILKLEDRGTFITLPFIKEGAEVIAPGDYWVGVTGYTNYSADNKVRFNVGNDKTVPVTKDGTYVHSGGKFLITYDNAVINLNIVPTTPVPADVTFNVNMKCQITKGVFDPTSDKVNIGGGFNEWGLTEMTDTDNDSIYTYVLTGYNVGNDLEFKYRINDGWETVDANRTHKISATPAENILTAWYSNDDCNDGIEDFINLNEISIYPNPVSSELHIDNINNINRIVISNVLGQEVKTINNPVNSVTINASDFNKGMYILTIIDNNNNSKSTRFIKK